MIRLVAGPASWTENFATIADKWFIGLTMTMLGIVVVMLILTLISFLVALMSRLVNGKKRSGTDAVETPAPAPVRNTPQQQTTDQTQLIAVLTAAVAAYRSNEKAGPGAGFIVRRIRRV